MAREFAVSFYKSPEWQKKRAYILIRDKYKCVKCGSTGDLEVHHITHLTPDNIHDANVTLNDANLITLCRDCHFAEHSKDKANGIRNGKGKHHEDCGKEYMFDENGFLVEAPLVK